jgi:hypothetical protein
VVDNLLDGDLMPVYGVEAQRASGSCCYFSTLPTARPGAQHSAYDRYRLSYVSHLTACSQEHAAVADALGNVPSAAGKLPEHVGVHLHGNWTRPSLRATYTCKAHQHAFEVGTRRPAAHII